MTHQPPEQVVGVWAFPDKLTSVATHAICVSLLGLIASTHIQTAGHSLSNGVDQKFRLQKLC